MHTPTISSLKVAAIGLLLLVGSTTACKHDTSATAAAVALSPAATAAVQAQFAVLSDSVDLKWRSMTTSDDQKIGVTRLLLRELQGQPGIDATQLPGLERANTRLKTRRYNQQSMASSALIDQYDAAQDSLLKALYPVAAPNGNAHSENARNFVEGIQQIDAGVVGFRVQYDRAAKQYNSYLRLHQPELQSLGGKYAEAKPLPLFTIGAE